MEKSASNPGQPIGVHILAYFQDKNSEKCAGILKNVEIKLRQSSGTPEIAIKIISKYGSVSSLAHPKEYFLPMEGLNGVECIYTTHSDHEINQLKKIACKYNLIFTGGTDFLGTRKPGVDLGNGFGNLEIPYEIVDFIKNRPLAG